MATDVPQRALRNETAALLRRVQAGERLRVTVHGHPVAELVPLETQPAFTSGQRFLEEVAGILAPGDRWAVEIRDDSDVARDPFE